MFSVERNALVCKLYVKVSRLNKSADEWHRKGNRPMERACLRKRLKFLKKIHELKHKHMQDDPDIFILS